MQETENRWYSFLMVRRGPRISLLGTAGMSFTFKNQTVQAVHWEFIGRPPFFAINQPLVAKITSMAIKCYQWGIWIPTTITKGLPFQWDPTWPHFFPTHAVRIGEENWKCVPFGVRSITTPFTPSIYKWSEVGAQLLYNYIAQLGFMAIGTIVR